MSKRTLFVLVVAMAAVLAVSGTALAKTYKIGVTVIVSHPALESDQKGFEKAIAEAGLEAEYDYQNAQGDMANATTIAQKFKNDDLDLVHAIATPTSQAAVKVIKNHPIVYSSVTDPVDAGHCRHIPNQQRQVCNIAVVHEAAIGIHVLPEQVNFAYPLLCQAGHLGEHVIERTADFFTTGIRYDTEAAVFTAAFHNRDKCRRTISAWLWHAVKLFYLRETDIDEFFMVVTDA